MAAPSTTENTVLEEWPPADPAVREGLRALPPSATLVAWVLAAEGPLAQDAIASTSLLPTRTVRYGLNRLQEDGFLAARPSVQDARKQVYVLTR